MPTLYDYMIFRLKKAGLALLRFPGLRATGSYQVAPIEVRRSMGLGAHLRVGPLTQGGHVIPPLQKLNYLFDRILRPLRKAILSS